jgi:hypothetical protein
MRLAWALAGALAAGTVLCLLSAAQKTALGVDAANPLGYLAPLSFGLCSGAALGWYCRRVRELNLAMASRVEALESLLPICASCKRIRRPGGDPHSPADWVQPEAYLAEAGGLAFSHGICPDCRARLYPGM